MNDPYIRPLVLSVKSYLYANEVSPADNLDDKGRTYCTTIPNE